jgi:hypothetical protein
MILTTRFKSSDKFPEYTRVYLDDKRNTSIYLNVCGHMCEAITPSCCLCDVEPTLCPVCQISEELLERTQDEVQ